MKINLMDQGLDPSKKQEVTKVEFFRQFFNLLKLKIQLTDSEIKVLSTLWAGRELKTCGISANNLPPVLEKLENKKFLKDKELSTMSKQYIKLLTKEDDIEIVFNYKLIDNDSG